MKSAAKPAESAICAQSLARRLDRLMLWSQLSLLKLARWIVQQAGVWAPLDHAVQRALAPKINTLGKFILALIVLKAGLRAKRRGHVPFRPRKGYASPKAKHNLRRLFGVRLRKLYSTKADLRAQIAALLAVLRDAEAHIERFARRLARGFTRRQGGIPRAAFGSQQLRHAPFAMEAANTS